mmetsp:Transcript_5341/g.16141  ORF Transcript_5341/g.16141 Transcript_5341/m.16141 type:complete len:239 (-) Transcript_5341:86-802(-)
MQRVVLVRFLFESLEEFVNILLDLLGTLSLLRHTLSLSLSSLSSLPPTVQTRHNFFQTTTHERSEDSFESSRHASSAPLSLLLSLSLAKASSSSLFRLSCSALAACSSSSFLFSSSLSRLCSRIQSLCEKEKSQPGLSPITMTSSRIGKNSSSMSSPSQSPARFRIASKSSVSRSLSYKSPYLSTSLPSLLLLAAPRCNQYFGTYSSRTSCASTQRLYHSIERMSTSWDLRASAFQSM